MEFVISQTKYGNIKELVPDAVFIGYSQFRHPVYKVEVPDLDFLLSLLLMVDNPLIIDRFEDTLPSPHFQIEIYNDYRE